MGINPASGRARQCDLAEAGHGFANPVAGRVCISHEPVVDLTLEFPPGCGVSRIRHKVDQFARIFLQVEEFVRAIGIPMDILPSISSDHPNWTVFVVDRFLVRARRDNYQVRSGTRSSTERGCETPTR